MGQIAPLHPQNAAHAAGSAVPGGLSGLVGPKKPSAAPVKDQFAPLYWEPRRVEDQFPPQKFDTPYDLWVKKKRAGESLAFFAVSCRSYVQRCSGIARRRACGMALSSCIVLVHRIVLAPLIVHASSHHFAPVVKPARMPSAYLGCTDVISPSLSAETVKAGSPCCFTSWHLVRSRKVWLSLPKKKGGGMKKLSLAFECSCTPRTYCSRCFRPPCPHVWKQSAASSYFPVCVAAATDLVSACPSTHKSMREVQGPIAWGKPSGRSSTNRQNLLCPLPLIPQTLDFFPSFPPPFPILHSGTSASLFLASQNPGHRCAPPNSVHTPCTSHCSQGQKYNQPLQLPTLRSVCNSQASAQGKLR